MITRKIYHSRLQLVQEIYIYIYIFDNFYERIVEVDVSKGHGNKKH
jgi:hypothetical protein